MIGGRGHARGPKENASLIDNEDLNPFASAHSLGDSNSDSSGHHTGRKNYNRHQRLEVKVDIPEFEGKLEPDEFLDWLRTVERVFEFKDHPEDHKTIEFELLLLKCDVVEPEEQTIARYLGGLKEEIGNIVRLQPYYLFNDVRKLAVIVEKQQKVALKSGFKSAQRGSSYKGSSSSPSPRHNASKSSSSSKTFANSTDGKESRYSNTNSRKKCFKCQGYGHIAAECPNRKAFTIVEEIEEENVDSQNSEEEDVTYADHGDLLVVRRSLGIVLGPSKLEEIPKRHKGEGIHLAIQELVASLNAALGVDPWFGVVDDSLRNNKATCLL
ncbi:Zinc finger, CCHC-type [Dillenia turbinata]|uniref:Zinc finger, CCHC-type n=1 Tax=Dillenia turbinata TaxID=194707 RepID=A0AAN8VFL8_9MAGN